MKYDVHMHVKRLEEMLEEKDPCGCCPAAKHFNPFAGPISETMYLDISIGRERVNQATCEICVGFIDIALDSNACPCRLLGADIALERTRKALTQYYKEYKK